MHLQNLWQSVFAYFHYFTIYLLRLLSHECNDMYRNCQITMIFEPLFINIASPAQQGHWDIPVFEQHRKPVGLSLYFRES